MQLPEGLYNNLINRGLRMDRTGVYFFRTAFMTWSLLSFLVQKNQS